MKRNIDDGFQEILSEIETIYPGELTIPGVRRYTRKNKYGREELVLQIGSRESNIDSANGFLIGKTMREDNARLKHRLYVMGDKLSAMRVWLMTPGAFAYPSWVDHYQAYPLRPAPVEARLSFSRAAMGAVQAFGRALTRRPALNPQ